MFMVTQSIVGLLLILSVSAFLLVHDEKYMYGNQSIVVLLLILFSSALLLAYDEKYMYGNPVNSGTVINLIFAGLTLSSCREIYVW
jgi:hypothetical protein